MIVDDLRADEREGNVTQSARLRWKDGDFRLEVTVPAEFAAGRPDASPFVCASLLLAMRVSEDLDVHGPVSPRLLESAPRIVDRYASWDPRLYRARVRADSPLEPVSPAQGVGCFLSRGVDSMYSAASPRALPGALTHLVYCDRLEPRHRASTRAEEIRLAHDTAGVLGLPLVLIDTNVRELTDPIVADWEDMAGAGLSFLATSMSGGLGHMVIPSSDGPATVGMCGTSPLLDPLFSTDETQILYDLPHTRVAKVAWLSRERQDLLPYLKVCFESDQPDNCGRCSKCLLTMLALEAQGALGHATAFPGEVNPEALARFRLRFVNERIEFEEVERGLRARGGRDALVEAVVGACERGTAVDPSENPISDLTPDFRKRASRQVLFMNEQDRGPRLDAPLQKPGLGAPPLPRTTVMLPAYDADATLRESVLSVLEQTVPELEVLVVDDGSSTPVEEILLGIPDPRLRVIRHERPRGSARARNTALAAARAPLVAQLGANDTWEPDYLASVLPRFERPEVGLVYTNATILGHPQDLDQYVGDPTGHPIDLFPKVAEQNPIPSATVTMRTEAVRRAGGYAWWLRECEEHHLYMKLALAGWRFDYVHRRLARYRWPQPRRSVVNDMRRRELWELASFGSIAARHPRTPGPRHEARNRVRREIGQIRAISGRLPPREGGAPRVLVDPGSHDSLNLGDIAMLQVCVERLRRRDVTIEVVTADPDRLARYCSDVAPVPANGLYEWFDLRKRGGTYSQLLPARARTGLLRTSRIAGRAGPRAARAALSAELVAHGPVSESVRAYLSSLSAADVVIIGGRGGTTDVFRDDSLRMLDMLQLARQLGAKTALVSQGFGPATDRELRMRAKEVLPGVDLIASRDRLESLKLLASCGVAAERITVAGDDALAPAFERRPSAVSATGLGVGARLAYYSAILDGPQDVIKRSLRAASARHETELVPIPISLYPHELDSDALETLTGVRAAAVDTPSEAIRRAGSCRVVIAASYHAAVFALAQGVPVVALASTLYYRAKFRGLADMFDGGCAVVDLAAADAEERIAAAIDTAWAQADALRPALLAETERQIAAADGAYDRLAASVGASLPTGSQRTSNGSTSGSITRSEEPAVSAAN